MKYTNEWQEYDHEYGYDKQEYDIELNTGKIIKNCYPNAGKFMSFHPKTENKSYFESKVVKIRLSKNQLLDINY